MNDVLKQLRVPFHPSHVTWKPGMVKGDRALALAYCNLRTYMDRLDEVCGMDWSIEYRPWGDNRIIACVTINGIVRCSTGEMAAQDEKNEMGGTVAEAQAAKRACAMWGLGRYLYSLPTGWADYDPAKRTFTAQAKGKLVGILMNHYKRALAGQEEEALEPVPEAPSEPEVDGDVISTPASETPPHQRLWGYGKGVFAADWDLARPWLIQQWSAKVTPDNTRNSASELSDDEKSALGDYLADKKNAAALQKIWPAQKKVIEQRQAV